MRVVAEVNGGAHGYLFGDESGLYTSRTAGEPERDAQPARDPAASGRGGGWQLKWGARLVGCFLGQCPGHGVR